MNERERLLEANESEQKERLLEKVYHSIWIMFRAFAYVCDHFTEIISFQILNFCEERRHVQCSYILKCNSLSNSFSVSIFNSSFACAWYLMHMWIDEKCSKNWNVQLKVCSTSTVHTRNPNIWTDSFAPEINWIVAYFCYRKKSEKKGIIITKEQRHCHLVMCWRIVPTTAIGDNPESCYTDLFTFSLFATFFSSCLQMKNGSEFQSCVFRIRNGKYKIVNDNE